MKKMFAILVAVALIAALTVPALAAGRGSGQNRNSNSCCSYGDGVCDNGSGRQLAYSYRFIDEDGDGVCDLCPDGGIARQNGTGMRYMNRACVE